jgi:hypothetical protein
MLNIGITFKYGASLIYKQRKIAPSDGALIN